MLSTRSQRRMRYSGYSEERLDISGCSLYQALESVRVEAAVLPTIWSVRFHLEEEYCAPLLIMAELLQIIHQTEKDSFSCP